MSRRDVRYSHNNVKNHHRGTGVRRRAALGSRARKGKNLQKLRFDPRRSAAPHCAGRDFDRLYRYRPGLHQSDLRRGAASVWRGDGGPVRARVCFGAVAAAQRGAASVPGSARKFHGFDWRRVLLIHALAAGAGAFVLLTGFYVGIPIFLFFFFWRIAKLSLIASAAIALAFLGFTWLCFGYLLDLEMYQGYLYPMLFKN